MDEGKLPSGSYQYQNLENKFYNQQMNYPNQNYIVGQSYPNNIYFTANPACMESKSYFPNINELCYWDDKSSKPETEVYTTKDQNQFYNSFNTRDRTMKRAQTQWDPIASKSENQFTEERSDNLDALLNEAILNKFNFQRDNRAERRFENNFCLEESNVRESKSDIPYMSNYYEYCDDYTGLSNYLGLTSNTSNVLSLDTLDHQTEVSNEESDIVVEETDDEIMSEEQNKSYCNSCVICDLEYTHHINFYHLTSATPITMTSQQPVLSKLKRLIGPIISDNNQICSHCLGILNSIDHLQTKLNDLKNQLQGKFVATSKKKGQRRIRTRIKTKNFPNYRCKYCRKILSFKSYCRYHLNQHNRKLLCEKCGVTCATVKKFHRHICGNTGMFPEPSLIPSSVCENCNKTFRTKTQLKEHQNFCLGILPHVCEVSNCGKRFATATRLKNHTKLKHEKKFVAICSICNIGFVKLSDYKSHKITHSTDKKFQCQKCPKTYKTLSNLNFHLKSHQKTLPFMCDICDKGFMRKDYLETHTNNHKGIKNFACSICAKKFTCQKNLDSHFKYHDGSIKKKNCNICGKYLTTSLNEHLRIHTNLREFECDECEMRFNTKGTLIKHKRIKHVKIK